MSHAPEIACGFSPFLALEPLIYPQGTVRKNKTLICSVRGYRHGHSRAIAQGEGAPKFSSSCHVFGSARAQRIRGGLL
jgi:hypothetical protein